MPHIGAYEAKTHFPKLLARVQKGERFVITRHGRPVAELVPLSRPSEGEVRKAIENLIRFQETHSLERVPVRGLIDEGRRS